MIGFEVLVIGVICLLGVKGLLYWGFLVLIELVLLKLGLVYGCLGGVWSLLEFEILDCVDERVSG